MMSGLVSGPSQQMFALTGSEALTMVDLVLLDHASELNALAHT